LPEEKNRPPFPVRGQTSLPIHHSDPPWIAELRQSRAQKRFGQEVLFFSSIDSTNRQAKEEARRGAPEGSVIIADGQSEGQGRRSRTWESPPGVNLYASVILRPSVPLAAVPRITLLAGIAVARALRHVSGLGTFIKWPNDVLIGGKKIAGILAEMEAPREGGVFASWRKWRPPGKVGCLSSWGSASM
jgi:BirA family transcriptional regulator, biotin operon repressor / biotin---[acetyl-CoA-carboxylase] ligase